MATFSNQHTTANSQAQTETPPHKPLDVARFFRSVGAWPVEVPYKAKGPNITGWHEMRLDDLAIQRTWGNGAQRNIGLLNGADVGDMADADMDLSAARAVARFFLPETGLRWDRDGAPNSHHIYRLTGIPADAKALSFKDPTVKKGDMTEGHKGMLCELGLNKHALAPGSVHPNGEFIRFEPGGQGEPLTIEYDTMRRGMSKIAAVALLEKWWVIGRHAMALPLAGLLCRGGMAQDEAETFLRALCAVAGDDEVDNRLACLRDTYAKANANQPYSGGPTLEEHLPHEAVAKLREWLQLARGAHSGQTGPDGWPLSDIGNAPRDACDKHAARMQEHKHIRAMIDLAKALLAVDSADFDADQTLLNCTNGTLELRREDGEVYLWEHRAADLLTMITGAPYVAGATDWRLEEYKARFIPEPERWAFLEEAGGASLLGGAKRNSPGLIGESHSGKSMFLRLLRATGGSYAGGLDPQSLKMDPHGGDRARDDLLDLMGKRIVVMPEVSDGAVFDGALFKSMFSGGDTKKFRGLYQKHGREVHFTHMLWSCGNKPYGVSAEDDAAYERTCFVRFAHPLPPSQRDDREEDAAVNSVETRSALLAAMVAGFTRLYREKHGELVPPDEIRRETAKVRDLLNAYAPIVEPDDPDETIWEFTGNHSDGVLCSEAWTLARDARVLGRALPNNVSREKGLFESAMLQRGAQRAQARTRFNNREYWRGVRWAEQFVTANYGVVTLPNWDTTKVAADDA